MYDDLLVWCSEREHGTIRMFRDTHDWLADARGVDSTQLRSPFALANFEELGHIEIDYQADRWVACPPALVALPRSGGLAVLTGARPRRLMRRLQDPEEDPSPEVRALAKHIWVDTVAGDQRHQWPTTLIMANGDDAVLADIAAAYKIGFEHRTSDRLVTILPTIDDYLAAGAVQATPPGFEPRKMSFWNRIIAFKPVSDDSEDGAYEYLRYGPPRYLYRDKHGLYQVDRRVAIYAELRRINKQVLFWNRRTRELHVPGTTRLPLLYARTAVLCTGRLPWFSRSVPELPEPYNTIGINTYANIAEDVFTAIATRLGQEPRILT
jgi:hypothetical protein